MEEEKEEDEGDEKEDAVLVSRTRFRRGVSAEMASCARSGGFIHLDQTSTDRLANKHQSDGTADTHSAMTHHQLSNDGRVRGSKTTLDLATNEEIIQGERHAASLSEESLLIVPNSHLVMRRRDADATFERSTT